MFSVKQLSIATVGTMAISLGSISPANAATFYQVTGLDFTPTDINDSAQVVGENYLWEDGNTTDLNTLPGANNSDLSARAINNKGAIVGGELTTTNSSGQPFISNGSTISALPPTYNCTENCDYVVAENINDSGTITLILQGRVGFVQESDGTTTELQTANRSLLDLTINNQDQIVGTGTFSGGGVSGFIYENGNQTNLIVARNDPDPAPNNPPFSISSSSANDIDDLGNIVGSSGVFFDVSSESNIPTEATLWEDPTQPGVRLGTLGGEYSEAFGINNSQQIVGSSFLEDDSTQHAFLWSEGDLIDLNSLIDSESGWELTSAFEINDNGDIIGIGTYNGVQRGFVAKAVPEPSSVLGMLGLGVFGFGRWLKRKK